jgi:hypothetical protein
MHAKKASALMHVKCECRVSYRSTCFSTDSFYLSQSLIISPFIHCFGPKRQKIIIIVLYNPAYFVMAQTWMVSPRSSSTSHLANHTSSPIPFTPAHSPVYAIPVTLLSQWSSFSLRQPPQLEKPLQGPCYTSPWRLCVVRGIGP